VEIICSRTAIILLKAAVYVSDQQQEMKGGINV
jgi:hypothetical protein